MIVRTAACGHLERRDEAREWVGRIREIAPQLTVSSIRDFLSGFFVPEALAYQVDGLAKGWPSPRIKPPGLILLQR